ncbi:MAG: InlB B-repeat-containing protein [Christensenellales bacterium]
MKTRKTIALMLALLMALAALPWQGAAGAGPNTTDVWFSAEQTGGEDGKKDSTGIKLTFIQEVTGLTPDKITIENDLGEATKGSRLTGLGREWTIELAGVRKQGTVFVRVADFDGFHITNENGTWLTMVYRGPYSTVDIGRMNGIIEENKPAGMTQAPVDGSSIPASWIGKVIWGDAYPKRIKEINLRNTGMTGMLHVNELPKLETLDCSDNQLGYLRLDALPALSWVDCSINKLTSIGIGVSGLPALKTLYCYGNLLSSLPTDCLTSLKKLNISSNQLSQLFHFSVSNLTALTDLNCSYNQLSGIFDVSGLTALTWLNCRNNQLTGVRLESGAPYRWLIVSFNDMTDESAVTGKDIKWDGGNFSFHPQYVYPGFTAEQTGGANGTKTSTGIKLTFDRDDIWGLTEDKITLTNCTGEAIKGSEVTGSGNTWNLKLAQVTKPGDVLVSIADFKHFRVMGNPRPATVHKAGTRTYAVTVTGGTANGRFAVSAVKDAVISLTADAAPAGQHFIEWNILPEVQFTDGTGKQSSTAKFIMPAGDVTAEAIYTSNFNRADIAVINNIITVNGWNVPKAPADGVSVPDEWYGKVYWTPNATNRRVTHLEIGSAGLTGTLDVSGLPALALVSLCYGNQLTGLNVSGLTVLEYLDCRSNQLTGFNVSGLPSLKALFYTDNQLTGTLNVSGLPMLVQLGLR